MLENMIDGVEHGPQKSKSPRVKSLKLLCRLFWLQLSQRSNRSWPERGQRVQIQQGLRSQLCIIYGGNLLTSWELSGASSHSRTEIASQWHQRLSQAIHRISSCAASIAVEDSCEKTSDLWLFTPVQSQGEHTSLCHCDGLVSCLLIHLEISQGSREDLGFSDLWMRSSVLGRE